MKISEKQMGDVTVLTLSGDLINVKMEIHPYVKNLIEEGKKKIVIDLAKVKWFGSTALGSMMASYSSLKAAEGEMKIANPSSKLQTLFYQMKLQEVFETFESVEEALESFE
ncbi:MAG: STAS domain-containing protein [Candidatus Marinimicrobia bacterium]|nr:STAS domain-containing protein [Candidatus Neomarinimicrobiota bacterium]